MKRLALITVILGSALALVPLASAVVLSDGGGGGVSNARIAPATDPATQAVLLRSQGLANYYGAQTTDPATQAVLQRSEGLANYYGAPASKAVILRSKRLSDYYSGNAVTFHSDTLSGNGTPASTSISDGTTIDWNTALAATLGGMLLLALAATMVTRRRHQPSF